MESREGERESGEEKELSGPRSRGLSGRRKMRGERKKDGSVLLGLWGESGRVG